MNLTELLHGISDSLLTDRPIATTSWFFSRRCATTCRPINPVAPVTRTLIQRRITSVPLLRIDPSMSLQLSAPVQFLERDSKAKLKYILVAVRSISRVHELQCDYQADTCPASTEPHRRRKVANRA